MITDDKITEFFCIIDELSRILMPNLTKYVYHRLIATAYDIITA